MAGEAGPSVVTARIAPSRAYEAVSSAFDAVRTFSDGRQARKAGIRLFSDKSICAMMLSRLRMTVIRVARWGLEPLHQRLRSIGGRQLWVPPDARYW